MPILGAVVLLIQLCFAYHALKTGRPYREAQREWLALARQQVQS